jgi:hypothetical protein
MCEEIRHPDRADDFRRHPEACRPESVVRFAPFEDIRERFTFRRKRTLSAEATYRPEADSASTPARINSRRAFSSHCWLPWGAA